MVPPQNSAHYVGVSKKIFIYDKFIYTALEKKEALVPRLWR